MKFIYDEQPEYTAQPQVWYEKTIDNRILYKVTEHIDTVFGICVNVSIYGHGYSREQATDDLNNERTELLELYKGVFLDSQIRQAQYANAAALDKINKIIKEQGFEL